MQGRCNCGAITIALNPRPTLAAICHCSVCSRFGGTPGAYFLLVPRADFKVTGTPKSWATTAQGGRRLERFFCGDCGSSLYATGNWAGPYDVHVFGGVFAGDDALPAPKFLVWDESRLDWHSITAPTVYTKQGGL